MALTVEQKFILFQEAVETTKQAADSGSQGCHVGDSLAGTLEKTYNKMVEISETVYKE